MHAGEASDAGLAQEAETLRQAVDGALAQCLHVLYGVTLPHRDPDWGGMEVAHSSPISPEPYTHPSKAPVAACLQKWCLQCHVCSIRARR